MRLQWENGLTYRVNFFMWRIRNIVQLLTVYYFWHAAGVGQRTVLGYREAQIFTYLFGVLFLRSFILSSRTSEVATDITRSGLSNKLIKPINYILFWFFSDLSEKALNLSFAIAEFFLLFLLLRPPLIVQTDPVLLSILAVAVVISFFLYFFINFMLGTLAFWTLEVWAPRFLFTVTLGFLAGGLFPIDILPDLLFRAIKLTPFPYLLYFPMEIYLGRLPVTTLLGGVVVGIFWVAVMGMLSRHFWNRGLRKYEAFGG